MFNKPANNKKIVSSKPCDKVKNELATMNVNLMVGLYCWITSVIVKVRSSREMKPELVKLRAKSLHQSPIADLTPSQV